MNTKLKPLLSNLKSTILPLSQIRAMRTVVYSDHYQLLYYAVPKVACTTLNACMAKLENIDTEKRGIHGNPAIKKLSIKESNARRYKNYYRFSFVRNPWDRLFSCYKNKIYDPPRFFPKDNPYHNEKGEFKEFIRRYGDRDFRNMQFEDFINFVAKIPDPLCDSHFLAQHYFFDVKQLDFVGRFENFQSDALAVFQKVSADHEISAILSEKRQQSSSVYYKDAYNDRTRALVAEKYKRDIELFAYAWD